VYSISESNGLASGNSLEEAVLQAFLELVERDSVSIWWYNRLQMPEVDLNTLDSPYVQALREYYAQLGREVWVLDVTNDFEIPTFVAVSRCIDAKYELIIYGCGTHLDPGIGISRALTEMNQFLFLQEQGRISSHAVLEREHFMTDYWFHKATVAENAFLLPHPDRSTKSLADYEYTYASDILDDITLCFSKAHELGLEVLIHDMTRPDIEMNVVRVIMPGARHIRPRYAPGRLYDVPVAMGWRDNSLQEHELNPLFIWI
jgi:ribosomal protein S12 methylthiotransferase accessory factor